MENMQSNTTKIRWKILDLKKVLKRIAIKDKTPLLKIGWVILFLLKKSF